MPCALLGDRASGKTTFLGLLYSAQVKYGTGVQDDFRFHAPIQSLNIMSAVYEGMKDGRFPSATLKEEITELGFVFGYLRKVVGKLPYYIRQQNWVHPFSTLRFSAYDVSGEDIEEFIETGIASRPLIQQRPEGIRRGVAPRLRAADALPDPRRQSRRGQHGQVRVLPQLGPNRDPRRHGPGRAVEDRADRFRSRGRRGTRFLVR